MTFKNQKPKATPATNKTAERYTQALALANNKRQEVSELETVLQLMGSAAQAIKHGKVLPEGLTPEQAYQWTVSNLPTINSDTTPENKSAYEAFMRDVVATQQTKLMALKKELSEANEALAKASNANTRENGETILVDLRKRLDNHRDTVKAATKNVDRLTGEVTALTVESHDQERAMALASGRLAADILDGQLVDREALTKAEAKAATTAKVLTATRGALALAQAHQTEVREAAWKLESEIKRIESIGHRQAALMAIKAAMDGFAASGRPVTSFERLIVEMASSGGAEAVIRKDSE